MKLKKICVLIILTFTLLGCSSKQDKSVIEGYVDLNLHLHGEVFNNDERAILEINEVNITESLIKVSGSVSYGGYAYPLSMNGKLGESNLSDGVIAIMNDNTKNFDVVHFSVLKEDDDQILKIYLMRVDTREFAMFEISLRNMKEHKKVLSNLLIKDFSRTLTKDEIFLEDFWYVKIIEPVDD